MPMDPENKPIAPTTQTNIHGDVHTYGGFVNTGAINTAGGHFVARDLYVHYAAAELPPLHVNVPPAANQIIGRTELIEQMVDALCAGTHKAFALTGLPGVGKTALAIALAHHPAILAHFKHGVLWASLGPEPALTLLLRQWAEALGVDISSLSDDLARSQVVKQAIARRHLLVVIDDVWVAESAQWLQASGSNCYLLTTRNLLVAESFAGPQQTFTAPVLDPEPAGQLLMTIAPKAYTADPDAAIRLLQLVGGLPLAIRLLGGYLAARKGGHRYFSSASQTALQELTDPNLRLQLAQQRLGDTTSMTINLRQIVELSLQNLPTPVVQGFYCLGAFAAQPDSFTLEAAQAVTELDADGLSLLLDANLLTLEDNEQLSLHQTIADVARTQMPDNAIARHSAFYLAFVNTDRQQWQHIEQIYSQIKWAWAALSADENLFAYIDALHTYQQRRGLWTDTVTWLQRGLQQSEPQLTQKGRAQLLNLLGIAYNGQRRWTEAIVALEESANISRSLDDRKAAVGALHNLGNAYNGQGQLAQAGALYEEILQIRRELGDRRGEGRTLYNLGGVYASQERWDEAIQLYEQSLQIKREVHDYEGEARTLHGMGQFYAQQGRWTEAIQCFEQSLQIKRTTGDRVGESNTLDNLANAYSEQQKWHEAIQLYRQSLQILRDLGDQYQEGHTLNNLGRVYEEQGQWDEALRCYEVSLQLKLAYSTPQAAQRTMNNLARIYRQQQTQQQAIDFWTKALVDLSPDSPMYAQLVTWIQQLRFEPPI